MGQSSHSSLQRCLLDPYTAANEIKARAALLGFDLTGVASARDPLPAGPFDTWLARGYAGNMDSLARRRQEILHPPMLLPGARSVVCCAVSYRPSLELWPLVGRHPVSCYAWGWDYHLILKDQLRKLAAFIGEILPGSVSRTYVDSGPLLEKSLALRAGLGFIGKHTLLLNGALGSFLFLGEIVTDADIATDEVRQEDLCGDCRKCIDACPTRALVDDRVLDARKCISYRTQRSEPLPGGDALHGSLWGCDLCQRACPYNAKAPASRETSFKARPEILGLTPELVVQMPKEELKARVNGTPLAEAKPGLLKRNAEYILGRT